MAPISVLVVDDEVDFLTSIVHRLKLRKIEAYGSPSGDEALVFLKNRAVDVVVLDVKMAGLDGLAVLQHIKENAPEIEVIVLPGHASVESSMEGMKLGAFEYIIKPVRLGELMTRIVAAYERAVERRPGRPATGP